MKLYFQHANGHMTKIKDEVEESNAWATIVDDLRRRNPKFKVHYTRSWKDAKGWTWYDIGSWSEFYVMRD